ncbi:MAG: transglutaminase-like domain-containing protein [bacterium]
MKRIFIALASFLILTCGSRFEQKSKPIPKSGRDAGEVWLATYLAGKKIGYSVMKYRQTGSGFRYDNLSRMTLRMMGKTQFVRARSTVITNLDLSLRSFEFELGSQDGTFRATGKVDNDRLVVNTGTTKQTLKLSRKLYPIEALGRLIVEGQHQPGTFLNYLTFDGTVMDTLPTSVEILMTETLMVGVEKTAALKVRIKRAKFDVTTWLDENGMPLKEESQLGINSFRVTENEALADESGYTPDVLRLFAVPVDTVIPQPYKARRVVLEISGVDTLEFKLTGANQRISAVDEDRIRLEITVPDFAQNFALPITAEPEFLKSTFSIQSDKPAIKDKAFEITGRSNDAVIAARKILWWVFDSLQKDPVASLPNALDVLKNMKGDCNEHSVLYAALCRAVGIPTKVVVGLIYLDGAFYYHAWNEVYLDSWVPVDATFGEFPASAFRLKLAEGELSRQAEVLGLVRKIRLKVLEFY